MNGLHVAAAINASSDPLVTARCCDQSPNRPATKHFALTRHPIIEGYDPPEGWGWCYLDEEFIHLPDQTAQVGPIPRYDGRPND